MTNHIISKDKQYQTRDGRKVVILADNVQGTNYPVVGYVVAKDEIYHCQWTNEGKFYHGDEYEGTDDLDLITAPVVTVEYAVVWDNGYRMASARWQHYKDSGYSNIIGHMVRTTEEGKPQVYHFEPK